MFETLTKAILALEREMVSEKTFERTKRLRKLKITLQSIQQVAIPSLRINARLTKPYPTSCLRLWKGYFVNRERCIKIYELTMIY